MLEDSSKPDIICPACGNELHISFNETEVRCSECLTSYQIQKLQDSETGECWYNLDQLNSLI